MFHILRTYVHYHLNLYIYNLLLVSYTKSKKKENENLQTDARKRIISYQLITTLIDVINEVNDGLTIKFYSVHPMATYTSICLTNPFCTIFKITNEKSL